MTTGGRRGVALATLSAGGPPLCLLTTTPRHFLQPQRPPPSALRFSYSSEHSQSLLEGIELLLPRDTHSSPGGVLRGDAGAGAGAAADSSGSARWAAPLTHLPPPEDGTSLVSRPSALYQGHANAVTDIKEACFWSPHAAFARVGGVRGSALRGVVGRRRALGAGVAALLGGAQSGEEEEGEEEEGSEGEESGSEGEGAGPGGARRAREAASYAPGLGSSGYIVAGSDCGGAWVYDRASTLPVAVLAADADICNAVRPHPTLPLLATSGIERVVRLWQADVGGSGSSARVCAKTRQLWALGAQGPRAGLEGSRMQSVLLAEHAAGAEQRAGRASRARARAHDEAAGECSVS